MNARRRFLLFIPVETQRSRRAVVVGYYSFFAALVVFQILFRGPEKYDRLLPLTFYAAALLGGLTMNGPVRVFTQWQRNIKNGSAYGIDPVRLNPFGTPPRPSDSAYDERDIAARDHAHYLGYSALRWTVIVFLVLGIFIVIDWPSARVAQLLLFLSVPFCIVFLSLPQAILLWTEPDLDPDPADPGTQTVFKPIR